MKVRNTLIPMVSLATIAITGCLEHPITQVELCKIENPETVIQLEEGDVDILFVIDNSGSMSEEQERLARNFSALASRLDELGAHYRIGMTTTDAGNPRCDANVTTPEGGDLVYRSCLDRIGEGAFQFNGLDASSACTSVCKLSGEQLAPRPSSLIGGLAGGELAPRPWIEKIDGQSNLPDGVSMADAFACLGPQGIDGCGYEQPLESMHLALSKALADKEKNFGFMRDHALLSVVFVTDENDCSFDPAHKDIFFDSNKTFWEDQSDPAPTSAVCWNAGVRCEGTGPVYERCWSEDYSADGQPGAEEGASVLRPVSRYVELLQKIQADKQLQRKDVLVSLISGVPIGYEKGEAEIVYQDAEPGSSQQKNFGIAPGCTNTADGSNSTAVPPVREREVAEAFASGERNLYSICQDDFTPALEGIAAQIEKALTPTCGTTVVADADLDTAELEPDCKIQMIADGVTTTLPACEPVGEADWMVPAGSTACSIALTDPDGSTPSKRDDMSVRERPDTKEPYVPCAERETNVEFKLLRSGPRVHGARYTATCLSEEAQRCER